MSWRDRIAQAVAGIKAFHSSPHDFDRFDMSKIGTGQGAQVYGHGIYAAENPAVSGQGGEYWQEFLRKFPPHEQDVGSLLRYHNFDRDAAIAESQKNIDQLRSHLADWQPALPGQMIEDKQQRDMYERLLAQRQARHDILTGNQIVGPRTYELNINAQPDQFLKWDQPLSQQSSIWDRLHPELRGAIDETMDNRGLNPMGDALDAYTGRELYKAMNHHDVHEALPAEVGGSSWLTGDTTEPAHTSAYLNSLGVPGISYLDQGSRGSGYINGLVGQYGSKENALAAAQQKLAEAPNDFMRDSWQKAVDQLQRRDTSNYVIFDPGIIDIMRKYGLAGAAATGGMGAAAAPDQYAPPDVPQ